MTPSAGKRIKRASDTLPKVAQKVSIRVTLAESYRDRLLQTDCTKNVQLQSGAQTVRQVTNAAKQTFGLFEDCSMLSKLGQPIQDDEETSDARWWTGQRLLFIARNSDLLRCNIKTPELTETSPTEATPVVYDLTDVPSTSTATTSSATWLNHLLNDSEKDLPDISKKHADTNQEVLANEVLINDEIGIAMDDWATWWTSMRSTYPWLRVKPPKNSEVKVLIERGADALSCKSCDKESRAFISTCCVNVSPCEKCCDKLASEQAKAQSASGPLRSLRCLRCNKVSDFKMQNQQASGALLDYLLEMTKLAATSIPSASDDDKVSSVTTVDLANVNFDPSSYGDEETAD